VQKNKSQKSKATNGVMQSEVKNAVMRSDQYLQLGLLIIKLNEEKKKCNRTVPTGKKKKKKKRNVTVWF